MEVVLGNCQRRWSAVILALVAFCVWIGCVPLALSQPALLGQWPELLRGAEAQSVVVANGVAYVAGGTEGLFILNVSDATQPRVIGQLNTAGFSKDVVVVGTLAYIADSENGLVIADVTNPASPVAVGRLNTDGLAEGVSISGNLACVADGMSGLVIADVSNPAAPVRRGGLAGQGRAGGISVSGSRAYVAEGTAGLQVYDVSNPVLPVRLGGLDTPGFAYSVQIVGTTAYVADGPSGIRIVDCTVPSAPTTLGVLATPGVAMDVHIAGTLAAVAAGESGMVLMNVANPSSPSVSGTLATRGASFGVFLLNSVAYVADIHSGLLVVDVATPATPNRVGRLAITGETQGVQRVGNVGYLADWSGGVVILDLSNPGLPRQIGGYGSGTSVSDLVVSGTVAYVGDYRDGVVVLDVSNPAAPVRIGGFAGVTQVIDVELVGSRLYVAHGTGVEILDVSNPAAPVRLGGYATDGDAFRVKVVGSTAYVGIRDSVVRPAFQILNVANAASPTFLGGYRTGSDVAGISIAGNLAYLATLDAGIQVLNVATPATITRLATVATAGNARAIDVQAATAFVAEDTAGVGTFNVQDAANVGRTSLTNTRGTALGVHIDSGTAYVADGVGGLTILSQAAPANTPPVFGSIEVQQADEEELWQFTVTAQDTDVPSNLLSYVLLDGPAGMTMTSSGTLTWNPGESVGPVTNVVKIAVNDNGLPPLSATNQFQLVVREVNRPPQIPSPGPIQILELVPWNLQLSAFDPDLPANVLTYSLISGPSGLGISSSGLVSWTPGETQGPSVSKVVVRVTDDGIPSLTVTNEFSVTVAEVNSAPFLAPVANQTLPERVPFLLNLSGGDLDFPANNLEFSLVSGPPGMQVTPGGTLTWTPSEEQGPSTNAVLVRVIDDGNPRLSATNEFKVVVNEVNSAPVLSSVAPVTVDELTTLTIQLSSEDVDLPPNGMTYAAVSVPEGMTVSSSGAVSWTPGETQGPSTNTVLVRVTDGGVPPLSATNQFNVVVREVNAVPVMDPVSPQTVTEGETLVLTLSGSDSDVPENGLAFGLVRGPSGLTISSSGSLAWTPREDQGPSTNVVAVRVSDDANPSLSVTNEFTVIVRETNSAPTFRPVVPVTADELAHLTLPLEVVDGDLPANGLSYLILSGPAGLTVTDAGVVDWTPTEEQGPMVATVIVRVTDDGIPPLSATNQFTITLNEVNSAPVMVPVADQVVDALVSLGLFLSGSDLDRPANSLTYDLVSGPDGLTVSPTGAVVWKPSVDQVPSTNTVVVRVTDDGIPALSATNQFTVVALEVEERSVIQVGVDDDPAVLPYSPIREFSVENGRRDPAPGGVTRLPRDPLFDAAKNPGADDDFYVRGIYPRGFNGLTDRLVVPNDEPPSAWERALTVGDPTNRLNFRLTEAQASPGTWIRVVAEFPIGGSLIAGQPVPGFSEHEVALRFRNGAGEVTLLKTMRLTTATVMTAEFSVADVGALPGGNSIEFVRVGPFEPGVSYWVTFDFVRVEIDSGGNQAPVFAEVGRPEVNEGSLLELNLSAVDGDEPPTPPGPSPQPTSRARRPTATR